MHSWELVTAVDGPGTRLTVFLAGCPLRCLYCHNPDTWEMRRGEPVTADELLGRVARYRGVFAATGGGLTLSGGEPLMQPAFVRRVLHGAHAMGVHTALDTSGFLGAQCTDAMLDDVDLVLLDVKSGDPDTYRRVTGRDLAPTLEFGRRLAASGTEIWVRYVLVPGLTDDPANVAAAADHVAGFCRPSPGSRCCRSTRWAATSGRAWGCGTSSTASARRAPSSWTSSAAQFRARGLTVH